MNDRELLEYAAKAAELQIDKSAYNGGGVWNDGFDCMGNAVLDWHNGVTWNPLTDDGDALRLAAHLRLRIDCGLLTCEVHYNWDEVESFGLVEIITERIAGKVMEGTRRAIVRAAAEIGKVMK